MAAAESTNGGGAAEQENHSFLADPSNLKSIRRSDCPVLVIHSPDDEIIPYKFGQEIYDAASEPKQFAELKGTHNEGVYENGSLYKQIWQDWLD